MFETKENPMGFFRQSPDVKAAQRELDAYGDQQKRAGNREETDEFLRLNGRVHDAIRTEKNAKRHR